MQYEMMPERMWGIKRARTNHCTQDQCHPRSLNFAWLTQYRYNDHLWASYYQGSITQWNNEWVTQKRVGILGSAGYAVVVRAANRLFRCGPIIPPAFSPMLVYELADQKIPKLSESVKRRYKAKSGQYKNWASFCQHDNPNGLYSTNSQRPKQFDIMKKKLSEVVYSRLSVRWSNQSTYSELIVKNGQNIRDALLHVPIGDRENTQWHK